MKKRGELHERRLRRTKAESERLKRLSSDTNSPFGLFVYHEIFECELEAAMVEDEEMGTYIRRFIASFPEEPAVIRSALRGGRSEVSWWLDREKRESL